MEQVKPNGSLLKSVNHNYKTILLSDVTIIPLETMKQILALATKGVTIVFYRHLPNDVPGMFQLKERTTELKKGIRLNWPVNIYTGYLCEIICNR